MMIITSSGRRFSANKVIDNTEKRTDNPVNQVEQKKEREERARFASKCGSYGLNPDFYGCGLLDDNNSFFYLVGLDAGQMKLRSLADMEKTVDMTTGIEMLKRHAQKELEEVNLKAELLHLESNEDCIKKVKSSIKTRIKNIDNAMSIYNPDMDEIVRSMGIPYGIGCQINRTVYELVSYRKGQSEPYILENLNMNSNEVKRFRCCDFETLKEAAENYAAIENDLKLLSIVKNMKPADNVIHIHVTKQQDVNQLFLFA